MNKNFRSFLSELNPYVSINTLVTASEKRKKDVFTISLLELIFGYHKNGLAAARQEVDL